MLTDLYLKTTDPSTTVTEIFTSPKWFGLLIFSVIFHTLLYAFFANLASWVFLGRWLSSPINRRLMVSLLAVMTLGYIGRMMHVREMYRAFHGDHAAGRQHVDAFFTSFIFLG